MTVWITNLDGSSFWIYAALWIAGSTFLFIRAFSSLHKKRTIKDTPTSWLRSAAQGYTELVGRGVHIDGPPLMSPLSGRECLWYRMKSEEIADSIERHDGPDIFTLLSFLSGLFSNSTPLKNTNIEESDDLFYLDDDTGRCVIDPEGAHITPSMTRSWYGNSPVPDRGPALGGSPLGYRYKYTEEMLLPNDILYAIGDLKTLGGAGSVADMKEEVRDLLNDWKQDHPALLKRFDRNNDGEISISEWNRARKVAAEEVSEKHASNDVPLVVTMLKQTNDRRRPFIISSDPLHDLIDRYHRHSLAYFIGSLFTAGIMVWALGVRL